MARITDLSYRNYRTNYGLPEEERAYMKWYNGLTEEEQYVENLEVQNRVLINKIDALETLVEEINEIMNENREEEE